MRPLALVLALAASAPLHAQAVVSSPGPDRVAVTVYRDTDRGLEPLNLGWLGGYALVSETRRVRLPAGTSELRFEGVTGGIVPQSAIVTGLGPAVLEKNRDARLLSPGSLINAYLGERLTLRRTSKATGTVREQDAIVRSTADGILIQTEAGVEALRCTGLTETLVAPAVPADLSAKPTLSVRVRSPAAMEQDVTLSYITNNFDWQANYVGDLSPDGTRLRLFGWLTLANGDVTRLANASAQAVAGKLNRNRVHVDPGDAPPITINCWPQGTTSDIPLAVNAVSEEIVVTGSRISQYAPAMAPPPPPPPSPERGGDVVAEEERLGDVRLYRIPITVTVAPRSQKQVALLQKPAVEVEPQLVLDAPWGDFEVGLQRIFVTRNREAEGLGLALPAGKVALFSTRAGRRVLIGDASIYDYAVGERVEIRLGEAPGARARQTATENGNVRRNTLVITNDQAAPQLIEIRLPLSARAIRGGTIKRGERGPVWRTIVPANGRAELVYEATLSG